MMRWLYPTRPILGFDETKEATVFMVDIEKDGKFAFFTEHMPLEFEANEHFFKDGSGNCLLYTSDAADE